MILSLMSPSKSTIMFFPIPLESITTPIFRLLSLAAPRLLPQGYLSLTIKLTSTWQPS